MRLALLQPQSHLGDPTGQFTTLAAAARDLAGRADLLVMPELFMSGYRLPAARLHELAEPSDGPYARRVEALARETGVGILYGFPERHGRSVYNAVNGFSGTGLHVAHYRKRVLPSADERAAFKTGGEFFTFSLGGFTIAPLICYDIEFPENVRACALAGADIVIAPTALRQHWAQIAQMMIPVRALENGVFVAYANWAGRESDWQYAGLSCICGPDGQELARAGANPQTIIAQLDRNAVTQARERLPYLRDCRLLTPGDDA
jgi:predicted amidohydrolase